MIATLGDGRTVSMRMDDLAPASPEQIRARFRSAAGAAGDEMERAINRLEELDDVGAALLET